MAKNPPFI
ncbi:hypothetical protein VTL71DRAFT_3845 [Oculimacula yallundae]|uniref:Uncharacterized protein n=1 Tax=Oculimacula yallundae TaxID=86028 RepID=A0ABR4C4V3_9HELO